MARSFKPNMYAFDSDQIDTEAYDAVCRGATPDPDNPDAHCAQELGIGTDRVPIPVVPVLEFKNLVPVLNSSYQIYAELRKQLNVRRTSRFF